MLSVSGEGFTYSVMFCIFEHDWGWDIGKRRMTKMKRDLNEIPLELKEKSSLPHPPSPLHKRALNQTDKMTGKM